MNLPAVFQTILEHLDKSWEKAHKNNIIGRYGVGVVLLVPQVTLTNKELEKALEALKKLKSKYPGNYDEK